jgi:beta-lactamase class A
MKKIFIFFLILFGSLTMAQNILNQLRQNILNEFGKVDGDIAMAFLELKPDGAQILINEKENFHAASTMKTPVMIEVFKQAEQGNFNLDDSLIVKNQFKSIVDSSEYSLSLSDDSGEGLYNFIGKKKSIRELVYEMITVSSNLATNILIELVGPRNVMATMKSIGANDIKVLRGVEDLKAFDKGLNNTTTAYDLMIIFTKIAEGNVVSKEACKEMVRILSDQKLNSKIPAKLPLGIKIAHKTGSITGVEHDSGIIYLPNGKTYVLVLLAKNLKDIQKGIEAEANISKMIYDYMIKD